ncbi:MAG: polyprenyl synthetase family protein [Spirochaetia bacterium]|jgi:geranylgeranyl pyrophosphate synthase|nr:polyprenyl synthetase family protein [Spirochaetia bacterium]
MEELYNDRLQKIEKQLRKAFPSKITFEWVKTAAGQKDPLGKLEEYDAFCEPGRELLNRGGKRWRPVLMQLSCEIVGGKDSALPLTPLVEFPHNGSLVIDDIEDKSEWRRGEKAVHLIYGDDFAINAGNLLYFMPTSLIDNSDLTDSQKLLLYKYYSENLRRLHLGQGFDILWHNSSIIPDPAEYEQMCRFKTGSLARLAAQAGVIAGGGSPETAELLGEVCENMGVGFQILDDIKNLTTGNPGKGRGDDIVEGKKSLPVIYHLKNNPTNTSKLETLFKSAKEKGFEYAADEINEAIDLISSSGALDEAKKRAQELLDASTKTISDNFKQSEASKLIIYMLQNFVK